MSARALLAGLAGGALAGAAEAVCVLRWSGQTIAPGPAVTLVALSVTALAGVGALGAVAVAALLRALARVHPRGGASAAAVLVALLAAPLCVHVAAQAFAGARASRLPGQPLWSLGVAIAGLAAVFALARLLLARTAAAGRRRIDPLALALLVATLALALANVRVLPRLYPWFHLALAVASLAAAVVGVRLLLWAPVRWRWAAGCATALAALGVLALPALRAQGSVRYLLLARAEGAGRVLRPLIVRSPPAARAGDALTGDPGVALPPGPRLPADTSVLLVTIDALRPDRVGVYGHARATTPNLDALAARGVRFERAYAQAPHTSFSIASLMTGKHYAALARVSSGSVEETLPSLLRAQGWRTAAFYPPAVFFVDGERLAGFRDSHFGFEYVKCEFLDAPGRVAQLRDYLDWLDGESAPGAGGGGAGRARARTFVWVHLFEPHEPYLRHPEHDFGAADIDRYDSEVALADAALGEMVGLFRARRPDSVVVVTADHGEEFDDHGGRYHGTTLYDEQVRVPLVLSLPEPERGRLPVLPAELPGPVQLVDLAPTLLALLGVPVPARMRGTDLGPWLSDAPPPRELLPPAFAEVGGERAMVLGDEKLLCRLELDACALYQLDEDPGEREDRAATRPERVAELRARMDAWVAAQIRMEPVGGAEDRPLPDEVLRGRLGDAGAVGPLIALLAPGRASDRVRVEAARALAGLPLGAAEAGVLADAVAEAPPAGPLRGWLLLAAARAGVVAPERLRELLAAAERDLALAVALWLAEEGHADGVPVLLAALDSCVEVETCRRMVRALGTAGDASAVPGVLARLSDVMVRREVVAALGQLGAGVGGAADPALRARLRAVLRPLLLDDPYVPVRIEAAAAVARLGGPAGQAILRQALRREREASVRAALKEALAALRGA